MKAFSTIIDSVTVRGMNAEGACVVLDCRFDLGQPERYRRAFRQGHLPGAQYAHLEEDFSSPATRYSGRHPLPTVESLFRKLSVWGIRPENQVVVYDDAGGLFAARAWWLLRWLGYERVAVLDGGIQAWVSNGFELATEVDAAKASALHHGVAREEWIVDSSDIRAGLSDGNILLVDARNAERFAGILEPIDKIAGHIPGAINRPATDNLNDQGMFKSRHELFAEWQEILLAHEDRRFVSMCGSGVTACHNLLSLKIAGFGDRTLYPGSWSSWISDPENPTKGQKNGETQVRSD